MCISVLQQRRSVLSQGSNTADDDPILDEQLVDEVYRDDNRHRRMKRQSSRSSMDSSASESSGSRLSRQSSVTSDRLPVSRQTSTSDTAIQTTLGRTSHASQSTDETDRHKSKKGKGKKRLSKSDVGEEGPPEQPAPPELPQGFVVKYMGKRSTKGLWGTKHTRKHIEDIVESIGEMPKGDDLPLVILEVYYEGLAMRPHKKNKIKSYKHVLVPIQFISYGVQDTEYPRVFCFIMVSEMSSQTKSMEVHAYACDSNKSARQLAACLAIAFQAYSERLNGGTFPFTTHVAMGSDENGRSCEV